MSTFLIQKYSNTYIYITTTVIKLLITKQNPVRDSKIKHLSFPSSLITHIHPGSPIIIIIIILVLALASTSLSLFFVIRVCAGKCCIAAHLSQLGKVWLVLFFEAARQLRSSTEANSQQTLTGLMLPSAVRGRLYSSFTHSKLSITVKCCVSTRGIKYSLKERFSGFFFFFFI